jgi:hypothetical protein
MEALRWAWTLYTRVGLTYKAAPPARDFVRELRSDLIIEKPSSSTIELGIQGLSQVSFTEKMSQEFFKFRLS